MLRKYWYKLLAPVIITVISLVLLILYAVFYVGMGVVLFAYAGPVWLSVLLCAACLCGCGVSVYVLWERIKEIESGEEDDLSQY